MRQSWSDPALNSDDALCWNVHIIGDFPQWEASDDVR
jgi:hypothetical protein